MLIDVFAKGVRGKEARRSLDEAYITVNKNAIPFDSNPAAESQRHPAGQPGCYHARLCGTRNDARSVELIGQC